MEPEEEESHQWQITFDHLPFFLYLSVTTVLILNLLFISHWLSGLAMLKSMPVKGHHMNRVHLSSQLATEKQNQEQKKGHIPLRTS